MNINWNKVIGGLAIALLIVIGWLEPGTFTQRPQVPDVEGLPFASATTNFDDLGVRNLTTTGSATVGTTTTTADLSVTDDATVADDLTAADLIVGDWARVTASTNITLTAGLTITATGTYQPLTSSAAVTTSTTTAIADGSAAGMLLLLRNANASNAIIIDGAGANVECGGNVTLGANDTLSLIWNGSDWVCIALRDN